MSTDDACPSGLLSLYVAWGWACVHSTAFPSGELWKQKQRIPFDMWFGVWLCPRCTWVPPCWGIPKAGMDCGPWLLYGDQVSYNWCCMLHLGCGTCMTPAGTWPRAVASLCTSSSGEASAWDKPAVFMLIKDLSRDYKQCFCLLSILPFSAFLFPGFLWITWMFFLEFHFDLSAVWGLFTDFIFREVLG